jgi:hypothetical protein
MAVASLLMAMGAGGAFAQAAPEGGSPKGVSIVGVAFAEMELGALADRMGAACSAGDADAYLACVDLTDPVWATEQRTWAADFARQKPGDVGIAIETASVRLGPAEWDGHTLKAGDAAANVTWSWSMPGRDEMRSVSYVARFTRSANEPDAWRYAGPLWEHLAGEGVDVMFISPSRAMAEQVIDVWHEVRTRVHEDMQLVVPGAQQVKIYPDMGLLQHSIYLSYADPLSGWNEPGESIKLLMSQGRKADGLKGLLAHEYGHAANFAMGPQANESPWWVLEGIAEVMADPFQGTVKRSRDRVLKWHDADELAPWSALADFYDFDRKYYGHVYAQGCDMVAFVATLRGRDARNAWLRAMAQGKSIDEASVEALGIPWEGVQKAWLANVRSESLRQRVGDEAPAGQPGT